jgi:biotin transport system substrate-specific component
MEHRTAVLQREGTMTSVGLVVGAAALTAVCAQISFGYPVPTTLQTFAVLGTSAYLGLRRAVAAQLLYLAVGAVGVPVFANWSGGIAEVTSVDPTHASGGYLWGFLLAAVVVGSITDRFGCSFYVTVPAMLAGSVALYVPGLVWLHQAIPVPWTGSSPDTTLHYGLWPFLLGDLAKLFAAAAIVDPRAPWSGLLKHVR